MIEKATFSAERFGKFVLLERIGRGGMAEVYRSKAIGPGGFEKEFAVKKILPSLLDDEQFITMFIDEARLTAQLVHPNIVQVHELGEIDGQLYISMEFVAGKDLLDLLARCARRGRKIPLKVVLHVISGLLKGLSFAHMATDDHGDSLGIIHRDVSPSNILLSYEGHTKVSDFGIAKSHMQSQRTLVGTQKGKMGYMSPEQVTTSEVTPRSDLFAAGVILFEMLTMSRLFKAQNDLDVLLKVRDCQLEDDFKRMSDLPLGIQAIVRKALEQQPDRRFSSAASFQAAISDFALRSGILPDDGAVSAFLREMFADRIAEERRRRASDPQVLHDMAVPAEADVLWRYRDGDGQIHGPMRLSMMRELLESRAPVDSEAASRENGEWRAIASFETWRGTRRPAIRLPAPPVVPIPSEVNERAEAPTPVVGHQTVGSLLEGLSELEQMAEEVGLVESEYEQQSSVRDRLAGADWEQLSLANINRNRMRRRRASSDAGPTRTPDQSAPSSSDTGSPQPAAQPAVREKPNDVEERPSRHDTNAQSVLPILEVGPGAAPDRKQYGEPALSGDFRTCSAARLLYRLARSHATGLVSLHSADENKAIFFANGNPVVVETSNRDELLGNLLVHRGVCTDDAVNEALHYARRNGIRIGDALVRRGHVPPQQLFHLLTEQLTEKLITGTLTADGQWQWWPDVWPTNEPLPVRIELGSVIAQAVNERMTSSFLRQHFEARRRLRLVLNLSREQMEGMPISTRALRVIATLRPDDTVSELVRRYTDQYRWKESEVHRILYLLTELEVLRYAGEAPTALP